jgi:serine/threonine-protein kinase
MQEALVSGRYRIGDRIGIGGMAEVFRAEDTLLGRTVAIKILNRSYASNPSFVERFKREAQAAAQLDHRNVVPIYDWGPFGGTYFIAMGYFDGENLKQLLLRDGPLPEPTVLRIASQVASALREAHAHGIVHRDIKPHNILIDSRGQVKVTDFGIARAEGAASLTESNAVLGTADYISPEQAQRADIDGRSDLYSLGVVIYEVLTGQTPFHGDSMVSVALGHLHETPKAPRLLRPSISRATERVILKAMAKDPGRRFATAGEMRRAIDGALARLDGPTGAALIAPEGGRQSAASTTEHRVRRPQPTATTVNEPDRRGPLLPLALLLAALLLDTLAVFRPWSGGGATPTPTPGQSSATEPVAGAAILASPTTAPNSQPQPTATPTPTSVPEPSPTPAPTPTLEPSPTAAPPAPTPTPRPVQAADPSPTPALAPTPTPQPAPARSTPTPLPAPPPVVTTTDSGPAAAIETFYALVTQHDFSAAARLWTAQMKANYPPAENIDGRFANTTSISLTGSRIVSQDQASGSAVVAVDIVEVTTSGTSRWTGTWQVVRVQGEWLLNQPNLSPV